VKTKKIIPVIVSGLACLVLAGGLCVAGPDPFDEGLLKPFSFRNLGPYRMGVRMSDIAVPDSPSEAHLYTFYVSSWSGGVWKTTNNGTTFEPIFDGQSTQSIGDVTLAPSNPEIVWVGTGDAFCCRSSYAGDGVYKSTDGGKTWKNMGLKDSQHIARIVIHPKNPDILYVAAMGHLYSDNAERGVFKSADGGQTWEKALYINEKIGVVDLIMNPRNPDVLYAATYDKRRLPWQYVNGGPESGIYKSTDAGKTWSRLGNGLPTGRIGRIGIDLCLTNPDVVCAVVENANPRPATPNEIELARSRGVEPREQQVGNELYRTEDGGATWVKMNAEGQAVGSKGPYYFNQLRIDPNNDKNIFVTGVALANSIDGGRTWYDSNWPPKRLFADGEGRIGRQFFGDVRTLWIDPRNSNRIILGSDGGILISYDGGKTSDQYDNLPLNEFYALGVDMNEPYNIYGGLQDHDLWKGPSNSAYGLINQFDWVDVGGADGMFTQVDPTDSRWLYTTMQYGGHYRVDQKQGYRTMIAPVREKGKPPYRFIWCTPIHISPHDSKTLYTGGQFLLRSRDRGDTWEEISPDLSTNDTSKILPQSEGGIPGGIPWFAISSIAESPLAAGVIWVGTSDGKVQLTRDNGATWTDLTTKLTAAGAREDLYVSRVCASNFKAGTAYVTKNGYKHDDFRPFVFKTEDYGATWTPLASNLPNKPVNVIFEDRKNPDLLFLGNDTGVFVTINGGKTWVKMNNGIPNVGVHDLVVHPRENDLILATYGRGLYVTNIAPLQEINDGVLGEDVHLFAITPAAQLLTRENIGGGDYLFGNRHLQTPNDPNGVKISYYLKKKLDEKVKVTIADASGKELAVLEGEGAQGFNTMIWDMRLVRRGAGGVRMPRPRDPMTQLAPPGEYSVRLEAAGKTFTQKARITKTIGWPVGATPIMLR